MCGHWMGAFHGEGQVQPVCPAWQELRPGALTLRKGFFQSRPSIWVRAVGSLPPLPTWRSNPPVPPAAARVGLMHIGVFILLLLSGERNFGVRLNKPYSVRVPMDVPVFTGTHADLLIVVRGHLGAGGRCPLG